MASCRSTAAAHGRSVPLPERGTALDVGEEEGDSAAWQVGHDIRSAPLFKFHAQWQEHEHVWYDAPRAAEALLRSVTSPAAMLRSGMPMMRNNDPTQIDHADLREFAVQAAWVAKLEDAVEVLEELAVDLVDDEQRMELEPWEEDPLEVALSVVHANYEEAEQALEARLSEWLAQDPEHWPIFRLIVLDAWQEPPGRWREDAPGWVRSLGTNTTLAHFQQEPYGRQRVINWNDVKDPDDVT